MLMNQFYEACSKNKPKELEHILKDPTVRGNAAANDNAALQIAARIGSLEIFKQLWEIPVVRYNAAANNNKALCNAANFHRLEIFKLLWEIPAVRENATANNNEALVNAAECGQVEKFKLLWEIPAVRENATANNNKALCYAAACGQLEIFKLLWEMPAVRYNAAANNNKALCYAAERDQLEIFKLLWEMPVVRENVIANDNAALQSAAYGGSIEIFKLLWDIPAVRYNAAANNNKALQSAASRGFIEIFKLLWDIPAVRYNAAANNNKALCNAAQGGQLEIFNMLWDIQDVREKSVANPNEVVPAAAFSRRYEVLKILLNDSALVQNVSLEYYNTLAETIRSWYFDIIKSLCKTPKFALTFYYAINKRSEFNNTPFAINNFNLCLGLTIIQNPNICQLMNSKLSSRAWHKIMYVLVENYKLLQSELRTKEMVGSGHSYKHENSVKIINFLAEETKDYRLNDALLYLQALYVEEEAKNLFRKPNLKPISSYQSFFESPYLQDKIQSLIDHEEPNHSKKIASLYGYKVFSESSIDILGKKVERTFLNKKLKQS